MEMEKVSRRMETALKDDPKGDLAKMARLLKALQMGRDQYGRGYKPGGDQPDAGQAEAGGAAAEAGGREDLRRHPQGGALLGQGQEVGQGTGDENKRLFYTP